ncbi:MAG TPA: hypothetical protein VNF04_08930 [Stellaceae bacterium]|nr:hypothetical protein [Stellaceae bacterium]
MKPPDQRLFEEDLESVGFLDGVLKGCWAMAETGLLPENLAWPNVILWIAAAPRPNAPSKFYFALNAAGYRAEPPTGTFWDTSTKKTLEFAKRPKGRPDSRVAKVFRTDWENGIALYHPYDRHAAKTHSEWAKALPHLVWDSNHTIVDFVEEFHSLLHSGDYLGA